MKDWQSQAHVKWECKYHVVIVPKYREKVFYGRLRKHVGQILRELCRAVCHDLPHKSWRVPVRKSGRFSAHPEQV